MFKFFKKIFQKDKNDMENNSNQITEQKQKKKFEIEIYDQITTGEPPYEKTIYQKIHYDKPVIIEASSKADLDLFAEKLKICNQIFKIVRIVDDNATQTKNIQEQKLIKQTNAIEEKIQIKNNNVELNKTFKQKPKYYKIGDIDIKNDNGKIYQKQWMKLTAVEATNFRIVNDKTNSIFNMKDKHIEMKRWVLIENTDDVAIDTLETDLNGNGNEINE